VGHPIATAGLLVTINYCILVLISVFGEVRSTRVVLWYVKNWRGHAAPRQLANFRQWTAVAGRTYRKLISFEFRLLFSRRYLHTMHRYGLLPQMSSVFVCMWVGPSGTTVSKNGWTDQDVGWGTFLWAQLLKEPCIRLVYTGAIWRIPLNDPCAAATRAVTTITVANWQQGRRSPWTME